LCSAGKAFSPLLSECAFLGHQQHCTIVKDIEIVDIVFKRRGNLSTRFMAERTYVLRNQMTRKQNEPT
jgi:hypothetical protein